MNADRSWPFSVVDAPSSSAWPTPCAMPPCTWPSTIIGLTTLPKSSTAVHDRGLAGVGVDLDLADVGAGGKVKLVGS
jgi:hypothetical protein